MTTRPLTCDELDTLLTDYLEGVPDAEFAALEAHADICARCGPLVADLRRLRDEAAALAPLRPSRDLWPGVEARISTPTIALGRARPRRVPRWAAGAAAAAALVAATAWATREIMLRQAGAIPRSPAPAIVQSVTPAPPTGKEPPPPAHRPTQVTREPAGGVRYAVRRRQRPDRAGEAVIYGREIERLGKILADRRGALDTGTVAVLERSLAVIDTAIAQSHRALARDTTSRFLRRQYDDALDKKVELLRTAALLPTRT